MLTPWIGRRRSTPRPDIPAGEHPDERSDALDRNAEQRSAVSRLRLRADGDADVGVAEERDQSAHHDRDDDQDQQVSCVERDREPLPLEVERDWWLRDDVVVERLRQDQLHAREDLL